MKPIAFFLLTLGLVQNGAPTCAVKLRVLDATVASLVLQVSRCTIGIRLRTGISIRSLALELLYRSRSWLNTSADEGSTLNTIAKTGGIASRRSFSGRVIATTRLIDRGACMTLGKELLETTEVFTLEARARYAMNVGVTLTRDHTAISV